VVRTKAGRSTFRRVRSERWEDIRKNALLLVAFTVALAAVGAGSIWFAYRSGATHTAAFLARIYLAGWLGFVGFFFVVTGTFARRMGGTAEQWTSRVFRKVSRPGWTVFDNVPFGNIDVDHVVVGPRQVLAVETKWTSMTLVARDSGELQGLPPSWTAQTKRGARLVKRLLADNGLDFDVVPVLVVWGAGVGRSEKGWFKTGPVTVLIGSQERRWRRYVRHAEWTSRGTHTVPPVIEAHFRKMAETAPQEG
jgi:hypothetical protein